MEITIGRQPVDGKIEIAVEYHETINGFAQTLRAVVWVDYTDSQSELHDQAEETARALLRRALSAHRA